MAGKQGWAFLLIASVAVVVFLITVTGSAYAASISGTVTDANGITVTGALVTLYHNGSQYDTGGNPTMTNTHGYFEFSGLSDGAYSIQADIDGYFSPSDSQVLSGNSAQIALRIPGYDSKAATPTVIVTATPSPTPKPTSAPTVKPTSTLVPLPTDTPTPGFGLLLVIVALGAVAVARRYR